MTAHAHPPHPPVKLTPPLPHPTPPPHTPSTYPPILSHPLTLTPPHNHTIPNPNRIYHAIIINLPGTPPNTKNNIHQNPQHAPFFPAPIHQPPPFTPSLMPDPPHLASPLSHYPLPTRPPDGYVPPNPTPSCTLTLPPTTLQS
ncbi:protein TRACHEARY ELEMENT DIFFERENTIATION-RELATED 7A-like [Homalodisca vitripennis]|uniref:protein TRACHEARY ELEMENT DIFFERENTIATION-RELATED 7A-like n=1 Tax=Homalodisca vitripennis TaxID=197043 RepID=UPI001EEC2CB4|nr:protein TRACHEARY ELEMENT DIFFERENTIATION-RELATED 7A-like [Homalodisca vitripennis]